MKNIIIIALAVVVVGLGAYVLIHGQSQRPDIVTDTTQSGGDSQASTTSATELNKGETIIIGKSVEGLDIIAYHYGTGDTGILLVGGVHGGYSWNTSLVAYQTMDYLKANPNVVPKNITVTIIPVLNPDGLSKVVGTTTTIFAQADVSPVQQAEQVSSRFNANNVDINRNFDCDWQASAKWQTRTVSGGSAVFSEPESQAIKNYVETQNPKAVVVWYSAAGGVYASSCHNGILPETLTLVDAYATASGYPAHESFDFYATTGDMVNWLAKKGIPAISVILTNHTDTEWTKNQKGIQAVLEHYAE